MGCTHKNVVLINPYEIIRKYRCDNCGGVMMCACEEEFARRFFPHQLMRAVELKTQKRVPVTLGFQEKICAKCRGQPEDPYPMASIPGRTSKIRRYYWREIEFETVQRFADWAGGLSYPDWLKAVGSYKEKHKEIEDQVVKEIQKQHEICPKYEYEDVPQSEIIESYDVEVMDIEGVYTEHDGKKAVLVHEGKEYTAEEFVTNYFKKQGYGVVFSESVPFHVLFGVFMWVLIQDPKDTELRSGGFGRPGVEGMIWLTWPQDFGTSGYYQRREKTIKKHLDKLPRNKHDLLTLFDAWLQPSQDLRFYLWAYESKGVMRSREILSILPPDDIIRILEYLVGDYWRRYIGWPDLIVYSPEEFFFVEVKSSRDKLNNNQKAWIEGNSKELHLPFKLVKIHRK